MSEIERRTIAGTVEVRAEDGQPGRIVGYAAVFDSESEPLGGFREIVRKGAFDRALHEKQDVVARAHHASEHLLGRVSNGTLRLSVDERGLRYEVDMPNTTAGRDVLEYVRRGDIRESSFAFTVSKAGQKWDKRASDGQPLRELLDVGLVDVAPVIGPAYSETVVSARAMEDARTLTSERAATDAWLSGVPAEINEARHRMERP